VHVLVIIVNIDNMHGEKLKTKKKKNLSNIVFLFNSWENQCVSARKGTGNLRNGLSQLAVCHRLLGLSLCPDRKPTFSHDVQEQAGHGGRAV